MSGHVYRLETLDRRDNGDTMKTGFLYTKTPPSRPAHLIHLDTPIDAMHECIWGEEPDRTRQDKNQKPD